MKRFSATTFFNVKNEEEFNKFMKTRVPYWTPYIKPGDSVTAVELALDDAIKAGLCDSISVHSYQPSDIDKLLAPNRARNKAPEAFRAMFAEV